MDNIKLIIMLTYHDQTSSDALEIFNNCRELPVQHWGFKNIGIPVPEMKELVSAMKEAGKTTYLEVVTYTEEECIEAAALAAECKFDYLMGTVYYASVHKMLKEAGISYLPFCGKVSGNPSVLGDTIEDVIESAKELEASGVEGTDILAYRFKGNPKELLEEFMGKVNFPVVIAGSIDSYERMDYMKELRPWGITMGSALFDKKFIPDGTFSDNLKAVAEYMEK